MEDGWGIMAITATLFVLKITGVIDMPWKWVFAPIWVPFAVIMVIVIAVWWLEGRNDS